MIVGSSGGLGSLAMVANAGGCMSFAGSPRKSALGKLGASTEDMKQKRAETKAAKQQRSDCHYEKPFENNRSHAPAHNECDSNRYREGAGQKLGKPAGRRRRGKANTV